MRGLIKFIFQLPSNHKQNTFHGKFQRFRNLVTRDRNGQATARNAESFQPGRFQITRGMARALLFALLLTHICFGDARITAVVCQTKPRERHCVIESMSLTRWKHINRYTFDWRTQRCYLMHWASYCPLPTHESNNFATEQACVDACRGWA